MANVGSNVVVNIEADASQFDVGMHRARKATKNFENQTKKTHGQLRLMRGGLGQVGHQIQDVAVQLQAGQNGLLVFGQQGSQIASLFGPGGAMIGAVLAVGAALGTAFLPKLFGATEAMKALRQATNELEGNFDSLTTAQRAFVIDAVTNKIKENNELLEQTKDKLATAERKQKDLNKTQNVSKSTLDKLTDAFKNYAGGSQFSIGVTNQNIETQEELSKTIKELKKDVDTINANNKDLNKIIDGTTSAFEKQDATLKKQIATFNMSSLAAKEYALTQQVINDEIEPSEALKLKAHLAELQRLEEAKLARQKQAEEQKKIEQDLVKEQEKADRAMEASKMRMSQAFGDGFQRAIMGSMSFKDAFHQVANSIINDLIRMAIKKFVVDKIFGVLTGGFASAASAATASTGSALSSITGQSFGSTVSYAPPSFEGGGFTGRGARSGGIDSRGGFPAILHPNETVVDHTKGQGMGVVVNQVINISTGVQDTVRSEIKNLMPQIAEASKVAVAQETRRGGAYSQMITGR